MKNKLKNIIDKTAKIIFTSTNGIFLGWLLILIFTKHINETNQDVIIIVLASLYVFNLPSMFYLMFTKLEKRKDQN